MPTGNCDKVKRKLQQVNEKVNRKLHPYFRLYQTYIVISILLGAGFKYGYDVFVSLIKPLLDILHLSNIVPISVVAINNSYLFSTSAAILATIFTIIFVLLTVFIQISDVYTSADIFQSNETRNLMRLYFFTIVLSLIMLQTTYQFPILILTLTFACILSIYPFLYNLNDKLVYDVGVGKLHKEISSLIDSNDEYFAKIKANSLYVIGNKCIRDNKKDTFDSIIYIFDISAKKAKKQNMVEIIETIGAYYSLFLDNLLKGKSTTNNGRGMVNSLCRHIYSHVGNYSEIIKCDDIDVQTHILKECGVQMIKADFDDRFVNKIVEILCNTFYTIQKKRNVDNDGKAKEVEGEIGCLDYTLEPNLIDCIGEITVSLYNSKKDPSSFSNSVETFFVMGAKSCQVHDKFKQSASHASFYITEELKKIEDIIGAESIEELFKKLKESKRYSYGKPEFETYLDMFKAYYDNTKDTVAIL